MSKFLYCCTIFLLLNACGSKKKLTEQAPIIPATCKSFGKVRDYTAVENCGFLIETEDGKILYPNTLNFKEKSFRLEHEQIIRFDYTILPNTSNLCNIEGKDVDFTCIELLQPRDRDCIDTDSPSETWMVNMINILRPTAIYKYLEANEIYYLYICDMEKVLYDCKGNQRCQYFLADPKPCPLIPARSARAIYKAERPMD